MNCRLFSDIQSALTSLMQWIMSLCFWAVPVCGIVVMAVYMVWFPEHFSVRDIPVAAMSCIAILLILKFIKIQHSHLRYWIAFAYIFLNTAMTISLLTFDTGVCSDYTALWEMAQSMADGTYDGSAMTRFDYGYLFNYQTGIAAFLSLSIRYFGPTLWPLKILNLILINLSAFLTYRIAIVLSDRKNAVLTLLLFCTFYPVIITVNQFTNQHVAIVMILASLLLMYKGGYLRWGIAGILASLMNVLRPEGLILVLTGLTVVFFILISGKSLKKTKKEACLSLALFVFCYFAVTAGFDRLFVSMNYSAVPVSEKVLPYFKFDKGLTGYDFPDIDAHGGTVESFNEWEKDKLVDIALHRPQEIAKYVSGKMLRYLGEFDWKFENTYNHDPSIYNHYPIKGFVYFGWMQYLIFAVLAAIGYHRWRKDRPIGVFQVFYIGITLVYLFIEAFSSYRYESYPILFVFAGIGWGVWQAHNQSQVRG